MKKTEETPEEIKIEDQQKEEKSEDKNTEEILKTYTEMDHEKLAEKCMELEKTLKQEEETVKVKTEEYHDVLNKYKRTLADIENMRKRTLQEKQDSLKYANFNLLSDLIVILDDFQRAIDSVKADQNMDLQQFLNGIEMIEKQFKDLLFKKYGTKKFGEEGEEFDPQLHQAMLMEEGDFDVETVLEVFRKGYSLHDRVVRHAQVKVGKPKDK